MNTRNGLFSLQLLSFFCCWPQFSPYLLQQMAQADIIQPPLTIPEKFLVIILISYFDFTRVMLIRQRGNIPLLEIEPLINVLADECTTVHLKKKIP